MSYMLNYLETMPDVFADAMKSDRGRKLYNHKINGQWVASTYQDVHDKAELLGLGFKSLGLKKGDTIALLSENRPEWSITDWSCAHFGFITVPVYPTSIPRQIEFILNHSEVKAVVASSTDHADKIIALKD